MNKQLIAGALCAVTILCAMSKGKDTDPVLMTVAGKDVKLSEFEYLYNKNNAQQLQPQSLDEYLDMFVTYKLKVADAEAAGIDTTAAFMREFEGYRNDLSTPYLNDKAYEDSIYRSTYDRGCEIIRVDHIMLGRPDKNVTQSQITERMDSIRGAIVSGTMTFEDAARQYSVDRGSAMNGGRMGFVTAGAYPKAFEDVVYSLSDGALSDVFTTQYGTHLVRRVSSMRNPGTIHARHILLDTRGVSPERKDSIKTRIDSIYAALVGGADFVELAKRLSDDTGSAARGGDLSWFGRGRMVAEFDSVAFSLPDNTISKPFETAFGYHVVEVTERKPMLSYDAALPNIQKSLEQNGLKAQLEERSLQLNKKKYPATVDNAVMQKVADVIAHYGGVNDETRAELLTMKQPVVTVDGHAFTVADIAAAMPTTKFEGSETGFSAFRRTLDRTVDMNTMEAARRHLSEMNVDYRNLLGEYRDGMLLYEVSNRNVWDRATTDTLGLENYFRENRSNYSWQQPHYKGYVVMAVNDSLVQEARTFLDGKTLVGEDLNKALRDRFGKQVRAERVVTAKGSNAIVDYVAFDGPYPAEIRARSYWQAWIPYGGRVIEQPEEATDVKGAVATDYQQLLESRWVEDLHKKYPVKINKKVLKKIK